MGGFSLRLLQESPSSYWLLHREEPRVPCPLFRNSLKFRHVMFYGQKKKTLDLVNRPLGVINGILLGYSIGNFHDVFSKAWCPLNEPHCRRFAMDLKNGEFLEVHWYNENICLLSWRQAMRSVHQYFVLYETPPPSKLPFKLKGSVELVLQVEPKRKYSLSVNAEEETCDEFEDETPFAFPGMKEALRRVVGVFEGTGRRASYNPFNLSVTDDFTFPYKQVSYILQDHSSIAEDEEARLFSSFGVVEPPLFSISLPVVTTTLEGAVMQEILRQESFHLQASDPNISDEAFQKIATREKRWSRRLWRNFRRQLCERRCGIEEAIVPLIAHSAAMHLGFSLSASTLKQHHVQFATSVDDEEIRVLISSLLKLANGLWIVSSSGENLFMVDPSQKQSHQSSQTYRPTNDKSNTESVTSRGDNWSSSIAVWKEENRETSSFMNEEEPRRPHSQPFVGTNKNEQEALIEKVERLESQNAILIQRIQQLERERDRYLASIGNNHVDKLESEGREEDSYYYNELNQILRNIDNSVYNEWEVVEKSQSDFLL
ncbi:uncharacterized protein Gasu_07920 [Galdieria sulphuraria]|uniref:Uncharacterized protein n=1 Tax=Galdieria sulphuraria TaxID=130081 RepID=M2XPC7_GALSU|nr:uncharacterized protein Gasu_07920 [Galdieria sulphuraria]EME32047.1 hypothetical protein Gasu_07920 [Galdieria sulphuraria]|eukprot:XP_005708567.1 hypothetical protein Gasu_07920 [Galdieria sulphuraria]